MYNISEESLTASHSFRLVFVLRSTYNSLEKMTGSAELEVSEGRAGNCAKCELSSGPRRRGGGVQNA